MRETSYQAVVIGSGPAGEGAAMQLAKSGLDVVLIEKQAEVGGNCTFKGTIPSKALKQVISNYAGILNSSLVPAPQVDLPSLISKAARVVTDQSQMRRGYYQRNHIPVIEGRAIFIDENTLVIQKDGSDVERVKAEAFFIAVGSRPYRPLEIPFDHPCVRDSDTILDLDSTPKTITIYGAGVIGCEYASMFKNLGLKVNLINTRSKLLEFLDDEIIDALAYHLRDRGILIRHREEFDSIEFSEEKVLVNLKSGKALKSDLLLWTNGRTGNTNEMGLDTVGLTPDSRGQLKVNENFQTKLPHVYAVGDVIGYPSLASAAYNQGRQAARHYMHKGELDVSIKDIPTGIYTSPEISSLGKTEQELTDEKIPYEVGHALFRNLARAQITGITVGMLKLLFHRYSRIILGIHCFGSQAAEIVHIGQTLMMQADHTIDYFVNATFNYPTMAEAYRVAALNGINRL